MRVAVPHMNIHDFKEVTEGIKNCGEGVGFIGAGLFFFYKFISGYLLINMSISVEFKRRNLSVGDEEMLVITTKLKKGDQGAVLLHDAQARVSYSDKSFIVPFSDIERLSFSHQSNPSRQAIAWSRSKKAPFIRMSPGEETEFSSTCRVPKQALCKVEVVILGHRPTSGKFGQWRASCVSDSGAPAD
jgi:hypothetical protein